MKEHTRQTHRTNTPQRTQQIAQPSHKQNTPHADKTHTQRYKIPRENKAQQTHTEQAQNKHRTNTLNKHSKTRYIYKKTTPVANKTLTENTQFRGVP